MTIGNWSACLAFTLGEEGGLVDDPNDPGGLTNYGISQAAYPDVDIRHLTQDEAGTLYGRDYWTPVRGDDLKMGVDLMVFDMGVNAGVGTSIRLLQRCIGVVDDGEVGPVTLLAAKGANAVQVIAGLYDAQLAYYHNLAGWAQFGVGWGGRVARRRSTALAMAGAPVSA